MTPTASRVTAPCLGLPLSEEVRKMLVTSWLSKTSGGCLQPSPSSRAQLVLRNQKTPFCLFWEINFILILSSFPRPAFFFFLFFTSCPDSFRYQTIKTPEQINCRNCNGRAILLEPCKELQIKVLHIKKANKPAHVTQHRGISKSESLFCIHVNSNSALISECCRFRSLLLVLPGA